MKNFLLACLAFLFFATPGFPADTRPLLPDSFGSWQAVAPARTADSRQALATDAWHPGAKGALILKEAGLSRVEERVYRNGQSEVKLRVFVLQDPSSAYEFYTYLIAPGMQDWKFGKDSAATQTDARFQVGNFVVMADFPSPVKPEALDALLAALKAEADPTPLPPLRSYLPEHWRVFGTEKYTLGPEGFRAGMDAEGLGEFSTLVNDAGFENGAEAILAKYQGEHGSGTLLLIDYPTPQLAEQHLHHLRDALPEAAKRSGVTVERKASLLSLVFASTAPLHAKAIRDEINYQTEVTWNEPHQTATDPPIVLVMLKIFVFTGFFLLVATIGGIAFGGLRVIIKRLLPGKVFDRREDIEVLQLGLSGKKIDPTDMY